MVCRAIASSGSGRSAAHVFWLEPCSSSDQVSRACPWYAGYGTTHPRSEILGWVCSLRSRIRTATHVSDARDEMSAECHVQELPKNSTFCIWHESVDFYHNESFDVYHTSSVENSATVTKT